MKDYNIKITFKSHCSEEDLKDDEDLIYKFMRKNFWNIKNFKYLYSQENKLQANEWIKGYRKWKDDYPYFKKGGKRGSH